MGETATAEKKPSTVNARRHIGRALGVDGVNITFTQAEGENGVVVKVPDVSLSDPQIGNLITELNRQGIPLQRVTHDNGSLVMEIEGMDRNSAIEAFNQLNIIPARGAIDSRASIAPAK